LILNLIIAVLWEKYLQNEQEEKSGDGEDELDFFEEEEDEDDEDEKNIDQNEGYRPSIWRRLWISFKTNWFSCEFLDKTEINRELGESHEIGLMEGR